MMTFQLVGKIGGAAETELKMFEQVETEILKCGFKCFNPLKHCISQEPYPALIECLKNIIALKPVIYLLPTFSNSLGSSMEIALADELKLQKISSLGELTKFKWDYIQLTDDEYNLLLILIEEYTNYDKSIDINKITGKLSNHNVVLARAVLADIMHNKFNMKAAKIAKLLNKDRTTVIHYLSNIIPDLKATRNPINDFRIYRVFNEDFEYKIQGIKERLNLG